MTDIHTSLGPITVEHATPADVDAVLEILTGAGDWLAAKGIDQWGPGRFTRERSAKAIERGDVYVARLGGEVVATLRLLWHPSRVWEGQPDDEAGCVHALAVRRAYAVHRIGLGLLRWAEHRVVEADRRFLRLDCMAANPALRNYYLRAGFTFQREVQLADWTAALFERECGR